MRMSKKKQALIWKKSVYDSEEDGILRCNHCKAKLFNYKTQENFTNMVNPESIVPEMVAVRDYMFCPDCGRPVGKISEIEVDDNDTRIKGGEWHERED